jgi:ferredoxin
MSPRWTDRAPWSTLLPALRDIGLNVVGVTEPDDTAREAGARSAIVLGSGGPALWHAFVAAIIDDPTVLTAHAHPLDRFIARTLAAADPEGTDRTWVRCAYDAERFVDFRPLAFDAGLGWPGRLGLLMHPDHGPWLGLRAVCFTTEDLPRTGPLAGPGPCAACPAPCATACPTTAVRFGRSFDIRACAAHKQRGGCAGSCAARNACPEGAASKYPMEEQNYHDDRKVGREQLARALKIGADGHVGEGPYWSDWAD